MLIGGIDDPELWLESKPERVVEFWRAWFLLDAWYNDPDNQPKRPKKRRWPKWLKPMIEAQEKADAAALAKSGQRYLGDDEIKCFFRGLGGKRQ